MKTLVLVGIVLVVLGVAALAYQGFTYTTRDTVVDIGPFKAQVERQKTVALPPVLGGAAVVAGVALIVVGLRRR